MYLTTEEELLKITNIKLTANLANRLRYGSKEFIKFAHERVEEQFIKRFNRKDFFESQEHAYRYLALIVFKQSPVLYFGDRYRKVHCHEEEYFTGEGEYTLQGECIPTGNSSTSIDVGVEYVAKALRSILGGEYTERYISYLLENGERPTDNKRNFKLNLLARFKAKEFANLYSDEFCVQ